MNNYKNLYKLIDGLNNKIKILESDVSNLVDKNKSIKNINNGIEKDIKTNLQIKSKIESYRILSPNDFTSTKKYIGLMFDSNFNNFETDENSGGKNLLPFIQLPKSNIIINYFIQLELNYTPLSSVICTLALGIRSKTDSKIKIIKGTRQIFDVTNSLVVLGTINLTNTSIYMCGGDEELCMIGDLGSICKVNPRKSLIKLLYIN
jgi:hypothetical protein